MATWSAIDLFGDLDCIGEVGGGDVPTLGIFDFYEGFGAGGPTFDLFGAYTSQGFDRGLACCGQIAELMSALILDVSDAIAQMQEI